MSDEQRPDRMQVRVIVRLVRIQSVRLLTRGSARRLRLDERRFRVRASGARDPTCPDRPELASRLDPVAARRQRASMAAAAAPNIKPRQQSKNIAMKSTPFTRK